MAGKERLEALLRNGKEDMIIRTSDTEDKDMRVVGDYIAAHALLPKGYDEISEVEIEEMKDLLLRGAELLDEIFIKTTIMILAHNTSTKALEVLQAYHLKADEGLRGFVKCAIGECIMWQEMI